MEQELLQRIEKIEERNSKVESEKAWEVSWVRFWSNAAATYLTMVLLLWTIDGPYPPLHAIVPTIGYVLSTLSIPTVKAWWVKKSGK
jgi:hypothetical protein